MQLQKLHARLDRFAAANEEARERIATEILDADQTTIRQLSQLWAEQNGSTGNRMADRMVMFGAIMSGLLTFATLYNRDSGHDRTGWVVTAVVLYMFIFGLAALHSWQLKRERLKALEHAKRTAAVLQFAARPRYCGRLLASLYVVPAAQSQTATLVRPAAEALASTLRLTPLFLREMMGIQHANLSGLLTRRGDHHGIEELVIGILHDLAAYSALEYRKDVAALARTSRHPGIRDAAAACSEKLMAVEEAQRASGLLLRPAEGKHNPAGTLVRPATTGAEEPDAKLLLRADISE